MRSRDPWHMFAFVVGSLVGATLALLVAGVFTFVVFSRTDLNGSAKRAAVLCFDAVALLGLSILVAEVVIASLRLRAVLMSFLAVAGWFGIIYAVPWQFGSWSRVSIPIRFLMGGVSMLLLTIAFALVPLPPKHSEGDGS